MFSRKPALGLYAILLASFPVVATAADPLPVVDFEQTLEEGIAYYKRGHFRQAQVKLELAAKHPDSGTDFRLSLFMARTFYRQLLLETAFDWAKEAKKRAGDDEILSTRVDELLLEMSERYGPAHFVVAEGETNSQGRVFLEAKTGIINKDKRQVFESIREHYRSKDVNLPTKIYLPYGEYAANSAPFTVTLGEEPPTVPIFLQVEREIEDGGIDRATLYIGLGSAVAIATGIGAYFFLASDEGGETGAPARPIIIQNLRAR